jgi:retron-type reverse transcriptase
MTSEERHELRYQRRVQKRETKKNKKLAKCNDFDEVFSFKHLYKSYKKCRRGVLWKASCQRYSLFAPLQIYRTRQKLLNGKYSSPGFYEFDLYERGKHRHIKSTTMSERVVQRCLCDYSLVPSVQRTFIYDNGACMKYKGYSFAVSRLEKHLKDHYRRYGNEGYILLFDFKKFFDNISHDLVKRIVAKEITDSRIRDLVNYFVDAFGNIGLGLGSQVSQVLALSSANRLDHYCKEVLGIKGYGRYSDDGYLIHHDKEVLQIALRHIHQICEELEIKLNINKTQIVKISHGFSWLKVRFYLTDTGKVIKKIYKRSITVRRRKMKKYRKMIDDVSSKFTFANAFIAHQSWYHGYAANFNAFQTRESIRRLYNKLFWRELYDIPETPAAEH